ncbi:DsbA family protein [Methylotenera sp. 1P/1]|uniref:DsbA family protein n=1 Tax=Methylotenera sp. 1P/1 TaxID=1131551 RepID=UPI000382B748|nr:DsbA family protein [Methylotenera sp. 1P/1]
MKLIYVADPMCSWCYGFSKEMAELMEMNPEISLEIVVGGLSAGSNKVLDDAGKRFRLMHWSKVEAISGLPFNREALMAREGFVYDSGPACRALVTAIKMNAGISILKIFRAIQHGFYVDGKDVTSPSELVKILSNTFALEGYPVNGDLILTMFNSEEIKLETENHFKTVKHTFGISSFPALLLEDHGEIKTISAGYMAANMLQEIMNKISNQNDSVLCQKHS